MIDRLVSEAKGVLSQISLTPDDQGSYFTGLKIWISASSHQREIIDLTNAYEKAYEKLGASVMLTHRPYTSWFSLNIEKIINEVDAIIMFAATPGISAKALEICWKSRQQKARTTEKLYIYMPRQFAGGFICLRLAEYGAQIRHLDDSAFCIQHDALFLRCLIDICAEEQVRRNQSMLQEKEFRPTIAIVTALPHELNAMRLILGELRLDPNVTGPYQEYLHGSIKSNYGGEHQVVLARTGKGNNKAAVLAANLLSQYPTVNVIFMVGIAAGVPDVKNPKEHVRLGDIVVCDEQGVIQYDMIKRKTGKIDFVPSPRPPSYAWLTRVENHIGTLPQEPKYWQYLDEILLKLGESRPKRAPLKDGPWFNRGQLIRQPTDPSINRSRPKVHSGPIASANTVLKSSRLREALKNQFKVKAIEMESSGIAEATWQGEKGYFVIRGICDFANDDKNKVWQPYAAAAAAAFARDIIETMPIIS